MNAQQRYEKMHCPLSEYISFHSRFSFPSLSSSWCYPSAILAFIKLGIKEEWTAYLFLLRFLHFAESFNYLIEKGSYSKAEKMNNKQRIQSSQRTHLICKIVNFKVFQTLKVKTMGFCLAVGVQASCLYTYCCSLQN